MQTAGADRFVALLRGINVGGRNVLRMADLRGWFGDWGFVNVETYIQSGNVVFSSTGETAGETAGELTTKIEALLEERWGKPLPIVVVAARELAAVVAEAPEGFGAEPDAYRYDVLFLRDSLTSVGVAQQIPLREGIDELWPGPGVVYFRRLTARAGGSYLSKLVAMPIYREMTIRNWKTTTKLRDMAGG